MLTCFVGMVPNHQSPTGFNVEAFLSRAAALQWVMDACAKNNQEDGFVLERIVNEPLATRTFEVN